LLKSCFPLPCAQSVKLLRVTFVLTFPSCCTVTGRYRRRALYDTARFRRLRRTIPGCVRIVLLIPEFCHEVSDGIIRAIIHFKEVGEALCQDVDDLCALEILPKLILLIRCLTRLVLSEPGVIDSIPVIGLRRPGQ
jgi:hypothetical protein